MVLELTDLHTFQQLSNAVKHIKLNSQNFKLSYHSWKISYCGEKLYKHKISNLCGENLYNTKI